MHLDATTLLASIACLGVFIGWLVLPHRASGLGESRPVPERDREEVTTAA